MSLRKRVFGEVGDGRKSTKDGVNSRRRLVVIYLSMKESELVEFSQFSLRPTKYWV